MGLTVRTILFLAEFVALLAFPTKSDDLRRFFGCENEIILSWH